MGALDGRVRFVFYLALLLLTHQHQKSPILGIELYARTEPELYQPFGLMALVEVPRLPVSILEDLAMITQAALLMAAIGLFFRVSSVVAALGFALLHGILLGSNAINNAWYVPTYALLCLCLARGNDRWSVDHWLPKPLGSRSESRSDGKGVANTGFALQLLLLMVAIFYLASGLSKVYFAGLGWFDGEPLREALKTTPNLLVRGMLPNDAIMQLGAALTLLLELGTTIAIFHRRSRVVFLVGLILLHVAIFFSIGPWYWPNCLCLALLLLHCRVPRSRRAPIIVKPWWPALGMAIILVSGALFCAIFHVQWWPFTNTPMYSSYNAPGIVASRPIEDYASWGKVQRMAAECLQHNCGRTRIAALVRRVELELISDSGDLLSFPRGIGVATRKQWTRVVLAETAIEDLGSRPDGVLNLSPGKSRDLPLARLLDRLIPVIKRLVPVWSKYQEARFIYSTGHSRLRFSNPRYDTKIVLASTKLSRR